MPLSILDFLIVAIMMSPFDASAEQRDHLLAFTRSFHIDDGQAQSRDPLKPFYFDMQTPLPGERYPFTVDIGTDFRVWLDARVPENNSSQESRSLAISITSDRNQDAKDKIIFSPIPWKSPEHIELSSLSGPRFISFDFFLDQKYEVPNAWTIHLQAWQCCSGRPPFIVGVTPGRDPQAPVEFFFAVRDDVADNSVGHREKILYKLLVARSQWNNVVLELDPRPDGSNKAGVVAMWFNGSKRFEYDGPWGYNPTAGKPIAHELRNAIGIDLGVYRRRQKTTQTILFNNIRFGTKKVLEFLR
jgi:hypothetical protein